MRLYAELERQMDVLPRPTLVCCKTNRRAGCVTAVYEGVKAGMDTASVFRLAEERGLTFLSHPGLSAWAKTVLDCYERQRSSPLFFRQLWDKDSSTYSYLFADRSTRQAVLVDPVLEGAQRDAALVNELGFALVAVVNTHVHADHVTGSGALKAIFPFGTKSYISAR